MMQIKIQLGLVTGPSVIWQSKKFGLKNKMFQAVCWLTWKICSHIREKSSQNLSFSFWVRRMLWFFGFFSLIPLLELFPFILKISNLINLTNCIFGNMRALTYKETSLTSVMVLYITYWHVFSLTVFVTIITI